MIYLDNNATTQIHPEVAEAMAECLRQGYANPASQHAAGRRARRALEEAREGIAGLIGATTGNMASDRVLFTSGGTEANNLAIKGLRPNVQGKLVISAIEHPSVVGPAERCQRTGVPLQRWPVFADGAVNLEDADRLLSGAKLVSIMLGNNETGVLQPVKNIAQECRRRGILMHTDAVQAVGKVSVDFQGLLVDAMTISAHKFHGPRGIGALVLRHGVSMQPLFDGGFQQSALRPGTESVALAVGMYRALALSCSEADQRHAQASRLRDLLQGLLMRQQIGCVVNGTADRLPHTLNVSFPGIDRQALVMALDMSGVCCSTGSACASGSAEPSPVLLAMGCSDAVVGGALRLSLSHFNTVQEIRTAAETILSCVRRLQRQNGAVIGPEVSRETREKSL